MSELEANFKFEWKRAADLPYNVTEYPQAVVINEKVYVGGRIASSSTDDAMPVVLVYDSYVNEWSTLPPYECVYFAMAAVNNRLVVIGGRDVNGYNLTAHLGVWSRNEKWTKPFAPMPTARCSASATTYIKWLVVVGGRSLDLDMKLSNVEILDTVSNQWYSCAPLPRPSSSISLTATVGNMCYALGGYTTGHNGSKKVLSVCLDDLISQAVSQPASATVTALPTPSPWHSLPDTPLELSTAVCLDGVLFAIGGAIGSSLQPGTSIYLYSPSREDWFQIRGVLPQGRERCACVALTDRKILIAGGDYRSLEVDMAEIMYDTHTL